MSLWISFTQVVVFQMRIESNSVYCKDVLNAGENVEVILFPCECIHSTCLCPQAPEPNVSCSFLETREWDRWHLHKHMTCRVESCMSLPVNIINIPMSALLVSSDYERSRQGQILKKQQGAIILLQCAITDVSECITRCLLQPKGPNFLHDAAE